MSDKKAVHSYSGWWLVLAGAGLIVVLVVLVLVLVTVGSPGAGDALVPVFGFFVGALILIGMGLTTVVRKKRITVDLDEPPRYGKQSPLYLRAMRRREERERKAAVRPKD